jgi:anti-sigma regulatory factor (Ser/Thr protein kinase)
MSFQSHVSFPIPERSYIGITKRDITKLAEACGFDEAYRGKIDIVVAELTSNLVKHNSVNGELLVRTYLQDNIPWIEILSVDNGPGMHDVGRMMADGVSTFGSKGEGLGAIKRMSDEFGIYSLFGIGTVILSRIVATKLPILKKNKEGLEIKAVCVPKKGERVSGDAWAFFEKEGNYSIATIDGLGHGLDANKAATEAVDYFLTTKGASPAKLLKNMHLALKKTRGAVASIAIIQPKDNSIMYSGVGNISGRVFSNETSKSLISYNGTVGHVIPSSFNDHVFPWNGATVLVLHSDGVKTRWDLSKYPGLEACDASVIAGMIYKDNNRGTDDALVVVAKR